MAIRQRKSTGELVMDLEDFRASDYGQLCQRLGLSPSRPDQRADGSRAKRPRRRRRSKGGSS
jgi:hypothetical protein